MVGENADGRSEAVVVGEEGAVEPLGGGVVGNGLSSGHSAGPGDAVDGRDEVGFADSDGAVLDEDGGAVERFAFEVCSSCATVRRFSGNVGSARTGKIARVKRRRIGCKCL